MWFQTCMLVQLLLKILLTTLSNIITDGEEKAPWRVHGEWTTFTLLFLLFCSLTDPVLIYFHYTEKSGQEISPFCSTKH